MGPSEGLFSVRNASFNVNDIIKIVKENVSSVSKDEQQSNACT